MSDCSHHDTISMHLRRQFGDLLCLEYFQCITCRMEFIKNHLLDGSPVMPLHSEMAQYWLVHYKTPAERVAAGERL